MNLDVSSHLHGHTVVKDHATFAAHLPRFAARFRANGSHHGVAADALRAPSRVALGLFVVLVIVVRLARPARGSTLTVSAPS